LQYRLNAQVDMRKLHAEESSGLHSD
jgi:hypothetical protein